MVATSATLALGGRFDTVARSLGLPRRGRRLRATAEAASGRRGRRASRTCRGARSTSARRSTTAKQGILYVAAHLPRPTASGPARRRPAEELLRWSSALGGRTLGLFSSRRAAERAGRGAARAHRPDDPAAGRGVAAAAGPQVPRASATSCLLGVMSLWQGVDVPGDACQLVVIDRLPFPRPDEPLAAARVGRGRRRRRLRASPRSACRSPRSGSPRASGRLIRSATDRGVVAVLDSRLETARGYGAVPAPVAAAVLVHHQARRGPRRAPPPGRLVTAFVLKLPPPRGRLLV